MPLQNRVFPDLSLRAIPSRGAWLGNRGGRFHKDDQTLRPREFSSQQWIYCVLEFKNRTREVFGKGYSELFFACEASTLASGHRPCFECQGERAKDFQRTFQQVHGLTHLPKVAEMDAVLHQERLAEKPFVKNLAALPNGAMLQEENRFYLKQENAWFEWAFEVVKPASPHGGILLTPPTMVNILTAGFMLSSRRHLPQPLPLS